MSWVVPKPGRRVEPPAAIYMKGVSMKREELNGIIMGIVFPPEGETVGEDKIGEEIKKILDENDRLENELQTAKERYVKDFLSSTEKLEEDIMEEIDTKEPEVEIKLEDILNL